MFTSPVPRGKIHPYPGCSVPLPSLSSRCEEIHSSLDRSEPMYARAATPKTVSRCHCRPSCLPSEERTPSATTSLSQRISSPPSNTTEVTALPRRSTPTALAPSTIAAPDSTATRRIRSSSSALGTALPTTGSDPPGHSSCSSCPNPDNRSPRFSARPRVHSPSPSRSSSAMARGVRPSPHVLSRGKVAESARITLRPARAAHAAAADPAGPAPMTRTSVDRGEVTHPVKQRCRRGICSGLGHLPSARHTRFITVVRG